MVRPCGGDGCGASGRNQHGNSGKHVGEAGRCVCRAERTGERDEPPPEERRPRGARRLWVV